MAIQGKLVKQDPNDEPASRLAERIRAEKEQAIKGKKNKKEKSLFEVNDDEVPFEIPKSWDWMRLGEIANIRRGASPRPIKDYITESEDGVNWIKIGDSTKGNKYIESTNQKITTDGAKKSVFVRPGDLIMSNSMSFGHAYIMNIDGCIHDGWLAFQVNKENIDSEWLLYTLNASYDSFEKLAVGTGVRNLNIDRVKSVPIGIPCLLEQKRIVKKIESLFSYIDKLDALLERKEKAETALPKAVVSAISKCQNEEELKAELTLVIEHFSDIFQTPDSLQKLREMILQLGIQGKLLPQNSYDEPARKLLERIETEKKQLIQDKKIKKEKKMPEIKKAEKPFEIPNSWEWVRLSDVTSYGNNTTVAPGNIKDEDWILELEDIEKKSSKILRISYNKERKSKSNKNRFSKGDVLYGKLLPYLKKVVVAPDEGLCTTEIIAFRGYCDISSSYLVNYFKTPFADNYINSVTYGMKMPRLGTKDAKLLLVPLPPIEEQRRIVIKIEALMKLIDQMESKMSRKVRLVKTMATV